MQILVATGNPGKLKEMREILKHLSQFKLLSLREFPDFEALPEEGDSLEYIASEKARYAAQELNLLTIADDSGLFVPALGEVPGIYSARYAGEGASDAMNRSKLLDAMKHLEGEARAAYFACSLAVATPVGVVKVVTGRCEGHITHKERGSRGFGYDSMFIKDSYDKTFAELDPGIKNKVSHRGKALEKLALFLEGFRP